MYSNPFFPNDTVRIVVQGITGREASMVVKHTVSYGSVVAAGVTPGKGGSEVLGIHVYDSIKEARCHTNFNTSLIYVPPAAALDAVVEALDNDVKLICLPTEHIPIKDLLRILALCRSAGATLIGPNCTGLIEPRRRIKLGSIGGDNPDRCFVPGRVGVISRSGGMTSESAWMIKRGGGGVSTAISIGGDAMVGLPPRDALKFFEHDAHTDMVFMWGEPGTALEEEAAEALEEKEFTKPLIAYVAGHFIEDFPEGTVFGHAAAFIHKNMGRPSDKMEKLSSAGAYVLQNYDDLPGTVAKLNSAKRK